jgi:hypothetical protein
VHAAGGADGGRQRSATERRIQLEAFGQKVKKFEDEVELTASQRTRLRECFRAFDANGDGSLTVAEFCAKLGLTSPTAATMDGVATQGFLARLFRAWDTNATGGAAKVLDFLRVLSRPLQLLRAATWRLYPQVHVRPLRRRQRRRSLGARLPDAAARGDGQHAHARAREAAAE